jgi:hypothetical protein
MPTASYFQLGGCPLRRLPKSVGSRPSATPEISGSDLSKPNISQWVSTQRVVPQRVIGFVFSNHSSAHMASLRKKGNPGAAGFDFQIGFVA